MTKKLKADLTLFAFSALVNYVVGILNSRLFVFLYQLLSLESGRVLAQVKPAILDTLPIRNLDFSDVSNKARYDKISMVVGRMLELRQQLEVTTNPNDKTRLEREIESTDRQIDQLVYDLYGLTEEETEIVEGAIQQ